MRDLPPTPSPPDESLDWVSPWPLELVRMLAPLRRGRFDPCHVRVDERTVWCTARPASGAVLARLRQLNDHAVQCLAWGPGAQTFVAAVPDLLGARDEPHAFDAGGHDLLARLHRAHPWLRLPRTGLVFEALTGAVLEQRVTTTEAFDGRLRLLRRHGEQPPAAPTGMPSGMLVVPTPQTWRSIPSWDWHRAGVDVHRAATLLRCAHVARRLDEIASMAHAEGARRLRAVRGVGVWTAAEVRQRALGDPDAVSYGDTHLARFVGYALTGEATDDAGMERLLEPWRGHRHRVVRLLQLGSSLGVIRRAPRIPRARPRQHLRF